MYKQKLLILILIVVLPMLFAQFLPSAMQWYLLCLNFALIFIYPDVQRHTSLLSIFFLAVFFREFLSIWNYFIETLPTGGSDSLDFLNNGCNFLINKNGDHSIGSNMYSYYLSFLYKFYGCSGFLSAQVAIMAMTCAGIMVLKISRHIFKNLQEMVCLKHLEFVILMMVLLFPSQILFSSLTLREPYHVLFFANTVFYALKLRENSFSDWRSFILMGIFGVLLGITHYGLMFFSFGILLPLSIIFSLKHLSRVQRIVFLSIFGLCVIPIAIHFAKNGTTGTQVLSHFLNGDIFQYIIHYRGNLPLGRTQYNIPLDFTSFSLTILTLSKILFHYFFEPFPSRIKTLLDAIVFLEVYCRNLLLLGSLYLWWHSEGELRKILNYLMILFISLSIIWAAGSSNVGTAIRHQMTGTWILAMLGVAGLMKLWIVSCNRYTDKSIQLT